jgi:Ni/Co efflux regulator RcnB
MKKLALIAFTVSLAVATSSLVVAQTHPAEKGKDHPKEQPKDDHKDKGHEKDHEKEKKH